MKNFVDQSGELVVEKLTLTTTNQVIEHLLVAACNDAQETLHPETAGRLLQVPARNLPVSEPNQDDLRYNDLLQQQLANLEAEHLQKAEHDKESYFEEENEKLERWAEDRRIALDIHIKQLDQEISIGQQASEYDRASR